MSPYRPDDFPPQVATGEEVTYSPAPPVAVGDLLEVEHECPEAACATLPPSCWHADAGHWCPEPPVHTRSLRVEQVTRRWHKWRVLLRSCNHVPVERTVDADGRVLPP
jgi:hypothetical protein